MGQTQAKAPAVVAPVSSWLDSQQQSALKSFCDTVLVSRDKLAQVLPSCILDPIVRVAGHDGGASSYEALVNLLASITEAKHELEAVCMFLLDRKSIEGPVDERRIVEACFDCFVAMLADDAGPVTEEERSTLGRLSVAGCNGFEIGRLLLHRCCGTGEYHKGSSKTFGGRLSWWLLQSRVDPRASWQILYSSDLNGMGAAAFGRAVGCYPAASVLVIRAAQGDVLGCYSETEWRSGGRFFGTTRCKVFSLRVDAGVDIFEATGLSTNFCYFHLPSSKAQLSGTMPDGVAVGGQLGAFRMHVDADFKRGECSVFDSAFASGQLAPKTALLDPLNADVLQFDVTAVEVWGLGGAKAMDEKIVKEQYEIKEAMKRRQVNRKIALGGDDDEGNVDMWLVETAGAHVSYVKEANHNDI
jgi:hypothetical protein